MTEIYLPHKLKNRGRNVYRKMFSAAAKEVTLYRDDLNYKKAVLLSGDKVVAIIESDATVGNVDDLTNELTIGGYNKRKYDGLEIRIINEEYKEHLTDMVLILKAILKEEITFIFIDKNQDVTQLLREIKPN